jgi:hypothetical protein
MESVSKRLVYDALFTLQSMEVRASFFIYIPSKNYPFWTVPSMTVACYFDISFFIRIGL